MRCHARQACTCNFKSKISYRVSLLSIYQGFTSIFLWNIKCKKVISRFHINPSGRHFNKARHITNYKKILFLLRRTKRYIICAFDKISLSCWKIIFSLQFIIRSTKWLEKSWTFHKHNITAFYHICIFLRLECIWQLHIFNYFQTLDISKRIWWICNLKTIAHNVSHRLKMRIYKVKKLSTKRRKKKRNFKLS